MKRGIKFKQESPKTVNTRYKSTITKNSVKINQDNSQGNKRSHLKVQCDEVATKIKRDNTNEKKLLADGGKCEKTVMLQLIQWVVNDVWMKMQIQRICVIKRY
ncbi:hypothetical protein QE152_g40492 [Popillia japonica]|uniref:Uncharacterized protein n=1 Tax=Popillia japonica TaxID=7064 RepID=A0AAW1HG01_POPJA